MISHSRFRFILELKSFSYYKWNKLLIDRVLFPFSQLLICYRHLFAFSYFHHYFRCLLLKTFHIPIIIFLFYSSFSTDLSLHYAFSFYNNDKSHSVEIFVKLARTHWNLMISSRLRPALPSSELLSEPRIRWHNFFNS